jgi:hypothetical protein
LVLSAAALLVLFEVPLSASAIVGSVSAKIAPMTRATARRWKWVPDIEVSFHVPNLRSQVATPGGVALHSLGSVLLRDVPARGEDKGVATRTKCFATACQRLRQAQHPGESGN